MDSPPRDRCASMHILISAGPPSVALSHPKRFIYIIIYVSSPKKEPRHAYYRKSGDFCQQIKSFAPGCTPHCLHHAPAYLPTRQISAVPATGTRSLHICRNVTPAAMHRFAKAGESGTVGTFLVIQSAAYLVGYIFYRCTSFPRRKTSIIMT